MFFGNWSIILQANYSGIRGLLTEELANDCKEYIMMDDVDLSEHMEPVVTLAEDPDPVQQMQVILPASTSNI